MIKNSAVVLLIVTFLVKVQCAHRTLDEAKEARQQLVKKYIKRLKKEDGAVKLVGGANDYEGQCGKRALDDDGIIWTNFYRKSNNAPAVCFYTI